MPRKPVAPVSRIMPGSSAGAAVRMPGRRAHRVEAAVDVEDLGGDRPREVGEQEQIAPPTGPASSVFQPSGACCSQASASLSKPGMPCAAIVPTAPR